MILLLGAMGSLAIPTLPMVPVREKKIVPAGEILALFIPSGVRRRAVCATAVCFKSSTITQEQPPSPKAVFGDFGLTPV